MVISSAFLSYHHSDDLIGEIVYQQLEFLAEKGKGKPALKCFLDVRDISPAEPWQPVIDRALNQMDWLIVIYTGEQSVYCGYEIGIFSQLHGEDLKKDKPSRRIMALHDVGLDKIPVVLRLSQNTLIKPVVKPVENENVKIDTNEVDEWYGSRVGRFLQAFCSYNDLYTADDENNPSSYTNNIALAAKRICNAFCLAQGTDVQAETPSQLGLEITVERVGDSSLPTIPPHAIVESTSHAFSVLGLLFPADSGKSPRTTWRRLNELLARGSGQSPWLHKVEIDIIRSVDNLTPTNDDTTFVGSTGKVYRPILVRHQLFVNGDRKFFVMIAETLDRRFVGTEQSSLILTAIILGSRLRFTYFENWSDTIDRLFSANTNITNFSDACRQLIYNIDWIEHESAEFGVADKSRLVAAFGQDNKARVERFFSDWDNLKIELFKVYKGVDFEINENNRDQIRNAILKFLSGARAQNGDFLDLSVKVYSGIIQY